jgi:hypothetical protein
MMGSEYIREALVCMESVVVVVVDIIAVGYVKGGSDC